jgi:hypothetical protein
MSDSFDTLVTLGEQIEAILEERDRLREALTEARDVLAFMAEVEEFMPNNVRKAIVQIDAALAAGVFPLGKTETVRAALAKEAGK